MPPPLSHRLADLDPKALTPEHRQLVATLTSQEEPLQEAVADFLPCALQQALQLEHLRQSHRLEADRIHSVTYVLLPGIDAAAVEIALLEKEWDWWKHGRISHWTRRDDGGCSFVLAPVWPYVPSKVGVELGSRTTSEKPTPWGAPIPIATYPARFLTHFEGPGRYEILALEGGSALRSVWDGVARLGFRKLMPLSMILNMHLGAEAGTLRFPLPKGTGFPGLVQRLKSEA